MWPIIRDAFRDASPQVRSQIRWVIAFWALMVTLQIWDSSDAKGVSGVAEFLSALLGSSGAATLGIAYGLQRTLDDVSGTRYGSRDAAAVQQVLIALPALGFAAGVALGAAAALMFVRFLLGVELPLALIGGGVYLLLLALAAKTVLESARTLFRHATAYAAAAATARGEAAAAQLAAVQARLNPHFLFNALNTVASLVATNPPAAERVVEHLSDVLRSTLKRSADADSTVGDEVAYLRAYLALEQERWGNRLRIDWEVDDNALDLPLPPLLLQPLVENAVKHGIGGRIEGGTIRIRIHRDRERLELAVEDDGAGFSRGWKEGTGLSIVRKRVEALFGERGSLTIGRTAAGASISLTIPIALSPDGTHADVTI